MQWHDVTVVAMENCFALHNHGIYDNLIFTITRLYIPETRIYTRNYTLVTTELTKTTGLRRRPLSSSPWPSLLCFVFRFFVTAHHHARKTVRTSSVFSPNHHNDDGNKERSVRQHTQQQAEWWPSNFPPSQRRRDKKRPWQPQHQRLWRQQSTAPCHFACLMGFACFGH